MTTRKATEADEGILVEFPSQRERSRYGENHFPKIALLLSHPDLYLEVIENGQHELIGFISVHIIPQLATAGDFARISYFSTDEKYRSLGAGRLLEEYCERIAKEGGSDRIEVHCHARREGAHRFYHRQGYVESPKYLVKKISN
jgi:GNAT superfamily N-acetyltransferase